MALTETAELDVGEVTLACHAVAFGILSRVFYEAPHPELIRDLAEGVAGGEWAIPSREPDVHRGMELLQGHFDDHGADEISGLSTDFHRLFIGPGRLLAPPWESVYLSPDHLLFEAQTRAVRTWYGRFGLEAPNLRQEPDDHLGLELAFMLHLSVLGLHAVEAGDSGRARELRSAQRTFLTDHLLRWAPLCLSRVVEHADTDFYRGVAYLAAGTMHEAGAVLGVEGTDKVRLTA